jgi:hypothetical protein
MHRALGRASLARRFCVFRLRRAAGLAAEGARPRVYECGICHRQESVTAGTVFHRTRTDLSKWFVADYLMGRDKRGVSAKFLAARTGGGVPDGLDHGAQVAPWVERGSGPCAARLPRDGRNLHWRRGDPTSPGRSTANPDKSLVVAACGGSGFLDSGIS